MSSPSSTGGGAATASTAPPPPSSSRRLPPPCWTNDETLALINSYIDKWNSLRRGNLRASHWEEVATSVSSLCRHLPSASPKTPVQCRHKVEKLRKRYRSEKQRSISSWIFFKKLDSIDFGGSGSRSRSASASVVVMPDTDDDDDDGIGSGRGGRMSNGGGIGGLRFEIPKAVRSKIVGSRSEDNKTVRTFPNSNPNPNPSGRLFRGFGDENRRRRKRDDDESEEEEEGNDVGGMVNALRMLGDGYMRMEKMKMEMAKEMEKVRMEMELKRTEMLLDCQRRILDSFLNGSASGNNKRIKPED